MPPAQNLHSQSNYSSGQRGNSGGTSLSSTSSSYEGDKGHRHPSPPYLLSQTSFSYSPTTAAAITTGKSYQSQSKDSPLEYSWPSSSSRQPTANQQVSNGGVPLYNQQAASSNQQQHAYSPSLPSTYSTSSSSLEPSSFPYASLHPGHMPSPSFSDDSRCSTSDSSSGHSHTGGSSSLTFPSGPLLRDERSKDEEKSVEPNILRFTYAELSEATDGFIKDMLGLGSFGTVFRAKVRGNGPYAVKKLYSVSVFTLYVFNATEIYT